MILTPVGELVQIDDQFRAEGWTRHDVRARGILTLALKLSAITSAHRWGQETVADLARALGTSVGLSGDWLEGALQREATLRRTVRPPSRADADAELRTALSSWSFIDGPLDLQAVRRLMHAADETSGVAFTVLKRALAHLIRCAPAPPIGCSCGIDGCAGASPESRPPGARFAIG